MKIAVDNRNEEFVAHSSCQSLLDNWWRGALAPGRKGMLKVKHFELKDYLYQAMAIKKVDLDLGATHSESFIGNIYLIKKF